MSELPTLKYAKNRKRPTFPKRAVITGGMPYGNKDLHTGHIGGVFVQADVFARFLRDRIGSENVVFVSGTDCYGSPIVEDYRKLTENGGFEGSLLDFVGANHQRQKATLASYQISLNLFAASSLEPYVHFHRQMGEWILRTLHENGHLEKRTTPQFYDPERETFLNGRQVIGTCPIQGCNSDKAYADECALGHQYEPKELLKPKSVLTGNTPEMRNSTNWYVKVQEFKALMEPWIQNRRNTGTWRHFVISSMLEHFEPPIINITKDQLEALGEIQGQLPPHTQQEGRSKSIQLVFETLEDLDSARELCSACGIRYRTGKTLVPFRLTGNLEWGLAVPEIDGLNGLTFWVWPESLWAPISFTATYLDQQQKNKDEWKNWWCSRDSQIYQFIGEDNVFFYGIPEMAMFLGVQGSNPVVEPPEGELQLAQLIANRHLLFLNKKASSSGTVKPPMAEELLQFYTADQLRIHFFSLGLGMRSVSFMPKPLNPNAGEKEGDPVLKEGNLLSNAFNRSVRSCFYTAQKFLDGKLPVGNVSDDILEISEKTVLDFEEVMYKTEFHQTVIIVGDYIRGINQRWSQLKPYSDDCDPEVRKQALIDSFHMVKVATVLLHPIAPTGTEMIRDYLQVGEELWDWQHVFEPIYFFMQDPQNHQFRFLEPRVDFFEKHPSQVSG